MSWKMRLAVLPIIAACVGLLSLTGCGPSGAPKTVKAKFKATYDDEKNTALPPMVVLQLHPESGSADYNVGTDMPVDGEYSLKTNYKETTISGAPPGKYKVTVQGGMVPPAAAGSSGPVAAAPDPKCADAKTTTLTVTIDESGTVTPNPLKVPLAQ
jgi:hypothetical protein